VPGYQTFWAERRASLQSEYQVLIKQYPNADTQYRLLYKIICNIEDVAGCARTEVGESAKWTATVNTAEDNRAGKVLFSALYGTYTVALNELKSLLKTNNSAGGTDTAAKSTQEDGFQEVPRRKRHNTTEAAPTSKKAAAEAKSTPNKEIAMRNFFAPLRATTMDTDSSGAEATTPEETVPGKGGRPPPVILTSTTNLIQLQRQLKNVAKGDFEFRNTKNGTRVITKSMTDFETVKSFFSTQNLSYYTFFPKSQKTIKTVLRHLPTNTLAQDISEGLVTLGFDVVSVKQMTTSRRSPTEETTINLPLFLITFPTTKNPRRSSSSSIFATFPLG
jgi:hypothetical protein